MPDETVDRVVVAGAEVRGVKVDDATRCAHYASDRDVVAIALPCCGTFYPCFRCHDELADHERQPWSDPSRAGRAVLCGACGGRLPMRTYLDRLGGDPSCPGCGAAFNPGCLAHRDRYVEG